ncbi:neuronal growth regulator 1-like [Anneissia japonica]|uniref:neuronal growth regulator 1-like n=1 Tax=Anneissia japonica TaxID=1529436 RepID=UPI0014258440|nr:neuronal growth regulator 1-like [Anneissia japonica]
MCPKMAGAKNTQESSSLFTLQNHKHRIIILVLLFYVEPNAGRSIDGLVADNLGLRVNEGDSTILSCFFSPSNAVIGKWYWKTNGTVIIRSDTPPNPNSRYSLGDATPGNVNLVIKEVSRWDKGTYTCGVFDLSTGSTVPHSAEDCKLTVNYLDNPKIQTLKDTRILEGTRVSMSCKVVSSYPEVSLFTWFHEGDVIDSASGNYIFNDETLEIKTFDQRDEGTYSCRAENEFFVGESGKYSNSIAFSFQKKEAIPPSSFSSQIWIVFNNSIPVFIIAVVVLAMYFWKKRSKYKQRFDKF